jgi:hypothetical protein
VRFCQSRQVPLLGTLRRFKGHLDVRRYVCAFTHTHTHTRERMRRVYFDLYLTFNVWERERERGRERGGERTVNIATRNTSCAIPEAFLSDHTSLTSWSRHTHPYPSTQYLSQGAANPCAYTCVCLVLSLSFTHTHTTNPPQSALLCVRVCVYVWGSRALLSPATAAPALTRACSSSICVCACVTPATPP